MPRRPAAAAALALAAACAPASLGAPAASPDGLYIPPAHRGGAWDGLTAPPGPLVGETHYVSDDGACSRVWLDTGTPDLDAGHWVVRRLLDAAMSAGSCAVPAADHGAVLRLVDGQLVEAEGPGPDPWVTAGDGAPWRAWGVGAGGRWTTEVWMDGAG